MADFRPLGPPQPPAAPEPPAPGPAEPAGPVITIAQLLHLLTPVAWVTPAITAMLVVAFAASAGFGVDPMNPTGEQLLAVGGSFGPTLLEGEWWRLLSATVLHAGVIHLAFNLWAFWNAGQFAERIFGNGAFLAVYLLSGVGSSLVSIALKPLSISVGASGAIFGVYGALLAFVLLHRGVFPPEVLRQQRNSLLGFLVINVAFGFTVPNIDLAGHLGGLVIGLAAGAALQRDLLHPREHLARRAVGAFALAALLAAAAPGVRARVEAVPMVRASRLAAQAVAKQQAGDLAEAIRLYGDALALAEQSPWYFNRGLARLEKREPAAALADFRRAHALAPSTATRAALCEASSLLLDPTQGDRLERGAEAVKLCSDAIAGDPPSHRVYQRRAAVYVALGRHADAEADLDKAHLLAPDDAVALNNRAWLLVGRGDFAAAKRDADRSLELHPDSASALGTRCFALAGLGELAAARRDCARAVELNPESSIDQGMIDYLDGNTAKAAAAWRAASEQDPSTARQLAPWIEKARAR